MKISIDGIMAQIIFIITWMIIIFIAILTSPIWIPYWIYTKIRR